LKIVTAEQMRELERRAAELGLPQNELMENAGLAVAHKVKAWLGSAALHQIVVLVGPGNNGGDGLVAARHLHDWGAKVYIYLCAERRDDDPNYRITKERGIPSILASQDEGLVKLGDLLSSSDAVIDALFGTGKLRPIEGVNKQVLNRVGQAKQQRGALSIIAVDMPSGVDADSGASDPSTVAADLTITLGYPKLGLFSFPASDQIGRLVIADIGLPPGLGQSIAIEPITDDLVRAMLPHRPRNAHKGTFGRVMVCAGSAYYIGAAFLACEAAIRVGAGLVTLALARSLQPTLATRFPSMMYCLWAVD